MPAITGYGSSLEGATNQEQYCQSCNLQESGPYGFVRKNCSGWRLRTIDRNSADVPCYERMAETTMMAKGHSQTYRGLGSSRLADSEHTRATLTADKRS